MEDTISTAANSAKKSTSRQPSLADVDKRYFVSDEPQSRKQRLPRWLDHFNARDLKILFKCSFAVWISTILIFIDPALRVLGQAVFFGCIILFIAPPSGVVFTHFIAGLTILLGLAVGWAWGAITMKAALATRPAADLEARYKTLQQSMPRNTTNVEQATGQSQFTQIEILEGYMLDTRVTLTYFCMLGLFIYLVSRLRLAAPKLTLFSMFALVSADIYLVFGPLIPGYEGSMPKVLIIPCAVAVAIGVICNIVIFPRSTSHIVLDGLSDVLAPMKGFMRATLFKFENPSSRMEITKLVSLKIKVIGAYKSLEASLTFLPIDFSLGRWGPNDISTLKGLLREVMICFNELVQLHMAREETEQKDQELSKIADALFEGGEVQKIGRHQLSKAVDIRAKGRHFETDALIAKTWAALATGSTELVGAFGDALDAVQESLLTANTHRVFRRFSEEQRTAAYEKHKGIAERLRTTQKACSELMASELFDSHKHWFDENGHIRQAENQVQPPPVSGLMMAFLWQERIMNFSDALVILLSKVTELEGVRTKSRLWWPTGFQHLVRWGLEQDAAPTRTAIANDHEASTTVATGVEMSESKEIGMGTIEHILQQEKNALMAIQFKDMKNRRARPRTMTSRVLIGTIRWLGNNEAMFALRVLVATIILAVPAVIPSSAGLYYREKGIWALIMAQFSLMPQTSDFISGVIARTIGTVIGGILGLLCWYIGSGGGTGNAYGLSAVMAVAIVLLMWWRLFSPPQYMSAGVMMAATTYLVVGYGWSDSHIPSHGNPGYGYQLFWRRILLVMIGFAVATIVTFVPRPPSGSRHYRELLAESISSVRDRYALFATNWRDPPEDFVAVVEEEKISWGKIFVSNIAPIRLTKWEFTTSNIDSNTLLQANHHCLNLNQAMTQLLLYTAKLPMDARERFLKSSRAVNENLIADIMAVLSLLEQSLRTGDPLPALLPTPLIARSFIGHVNALPREETLAIGKRLDDGNVRKYVSAVNAFVQFLSSIDDLVIVVKKAVGETSDVKLPDV